ncbi:MAG: T9SS type A sorting domain-containing protein [Calditrichia bacterium]
MFEYSIPKPGFMTLKIYDIPGRYVKTLISQKKIPGNYKVEFDGSSFASGIYFYRLQMGNEYVATKKCFFYIELNVYYRYFIRFLKFPSPPLSSRGKVFECPKC